MRRGFSNSGDNAALRRRFAALPLAAALAWQPAAGAAGISGGAERPAPDCTLRLANASAPSSIARFRGRVLYVDFWASWCPPCLKSFPFMNELQDAFSGQGLQVLAINVDEKPDDAARFLNEHPARFEVALPNNASCATDFNVQVMPSTFVVDRDGNIRHVHLGFRSGDAAQLRGVVEQLLAQPAAAR